MTSLVAPTLLADLPRTAAARWPRRTALRCGARAWTYTDLADAVDVAAGRLQGVGVGSGSRVLVAGGVSTETLVAQLAVSRAGAVAVMVNPTWHGSEVEHVLELTDPAVVLADGSLVDPAAYAVLGIRLGLGSGPDGWTTLDELPPAAALVPQPERAPDDDCVFVFSSGTTGAPKAVRHSNRSLLANVGSWVSCSALSEADRLQLFLPLFHTYGTVVAASALQAGASLRLLPRYDLDEVLANLVDEQITVGFGATPVFTSMAARDDLERHDLGALRYLVWGATPIVAATAESISSRTGTRWLAAYGASEAPVLTCTGILDAADPHLATAGRRVGGVELRIVDPELGRDLPDGTAGEILVRGPQVMGGYLPASANDEAFDDGWFRTGDVGCLHDGRLKITDRIKEMLKVSGFQVSPVELEKILFEHPSVADCAVYGRPDARRGELPTAAVVLASDESVRAEELLAWFEPRLARYKRLHAVRFVDVIPRTPSGKVLRRLLRDDDPAVVGSATGGPA